MSGLARAIELATAAVTMRNTPLAASDPVVSALASKPLKSAVQPQNAAIANEIARAGSE